MGANLQGVKVLTCPAVSEHIHRSTCAACEGPLRPSLVVDGFAYLRCRRCGTLNLDQAPSADALATLYQRDDTWTSTKDAGLDDPGAQHRETRRRLRLLRDVGANLTRVFELGPGLGYLARALVAQGSQVTAFELHAAANERLRKFGITAVNDMEKADGEYDTIMLWGVIEHLEDPFATLSALQRRVAPGGSIVILTEDSASFLARLSGARWTWLLPPEHIVLFSRQGLSLCLARLGFELAASRRWPANVRAITGTALGRARGLKLRRGFRDARVAADQGRGPRGLIRVVKRILDTTLWPLSEHKLYRFARTNRIPSG
jgi:SAM-dependent methyltransferase